MGSPKFRAPPEGIRGALEGLIPGFWSLYGRDVRDVMSSHPGIRASSWYRPASRTQHGIATAEDFTGPLEERAHALGAFRQRGWWGQLETNVNPPSDPREVYSRSATGPHLHVQRFRATAEFKAILPALRLGKHPRLGAASQAAPGSTIGPRPLSGFGSPIRNAGLLRGSYLRGQR